MTFPTQINVQPAPGVVGDFASANPRAVAISGPGNPVAGAAGVTIGRFAWWENANQAVISNTGFGAPVGFVHRDQQGLFTAYLAESGLTIPQGFRVSLFTAGDFWVANAGV